METYEIENFLYFHQSEDNTFDHILEIYMTIGALVLKLTLITNESDRYDNCNILILLMISYHSKLTALLLHFKFDRACTTCLHRFKSSSSLSSSSSSSSFSSSSFLLLLLNLAWNHRSETWKQFSYYEH